MACHWKVNWMDESATSSFFGLASSLSKASHAVAAILFAVMAHKMGDIKPALLAGRLITLIGCLLYLAVEFFPVDKRFVLLTAYLLFGIGFSTSPLLRALISRQSSLDNRSTAFAFVHTAHLLSILTGAVVQLTFAGLPYPGFEILPNIKVHIYTVPIWLALLTNIIVIFVIIFKLEDRKKEIDLDTVPSSFSLTYLRREFARLRSLSLPWILIGVIVLEKCLVGTFPSAIPVLSGPMMSAIYGKTGQETVIILALQQTATGGMAIVLSLSFVFGGLGRIISTRVLFLVATTVVISTAILTFPYPNPVSTIALFNESTRTGCNPDEYSWCFTNSATPFFLFIIPVAATLGFAIPSAMLSLDTIYSRLLGDIDQSVMQAVIVIVDDISHVFLPLAATAIFTSSGYDTISIGIGSIFIGAAVIWMISWRAMRPYTEIEIRPTENSLSITKNRLEEVATLPKSGIQRSLMHNSFAPRSIEENANLTLGAYSPIQNRFHELEKDIHGTVRWFDSLKVFGIISSDNAAKEGVFIHINDLERSGLTTLNEGDKVIFDLKPGNRPKAVNNIRSNTGAKMRMSDPFLFCLLLLCISLVTGQQQKTILKEIEKDVHGTVKWFNEIKGFGFIVPDDSKKGKEIFVHISALQKSNQKIYDQDRVVFDLELGEKPIAVNEIEKDVRGTVKWFNELKGYGFIVPDDRRKGKEIFVHSSSLNGNIISEDDRVIFDLELGEKVTAINEIKKGVKGTVKWFNESKGFGFINCENASKKQVIFDLVNVKIDTEMTAELYAIKINFLTIMSIITTAHRSPFTGSNMCIHTSVFDYDHKSIVIFQVAGDETVL
ncbi:hypothetical protein PRIPAC_87489, partial [Pristionchus pacificus]|uniref:Uncharacterized protein n=1 Tax=Pristionchus pacificus TaxID=54126 RepID=A0A2A6B675_PRIPA